MDTRDFIEVLQDACKAKGRSFEHLASLINVPPKLMIKIARGMIPEPEIIYRLARVLSLDARELFHVAKEENIRMYIKKLKKKYNRAIEERECERLNSPLTFVDYSI